MANEKIKAVLFDLDGTLVDTFESIVISFNEALNVLGAGHVDGEVLKKHIGAPHDVTLRKFAPHASQEELSRGTAVFRKTRAELTDEYTKVLPGVIELLENLRRENIKTGIVTTTTKEMTEHILKHSGLFDYFDVIVTRDDVKKLKPDPEPIIYALKKLKLNKDECIMAGDHPNDIIAAKAAGIKAVAIPSAYDRNELEKYAPDYVFDNIYGIYSLISLNNF